MANRTDGPASVLFVCLGNICRSPTGEAVLAALIAERGLGSRVAVDSAGILAYHQGNPADPRMTAHAAARGYRLDGTARQVVPEDFARHAVIVAMDRSNRAALLDLAPDDAGRERVRLLSSFLPPGAPVDVPDPYYGGAAGFEQVIDLCVQAAPGILDHLLGDRPCRAG